MDSIRIVVAQLPDNLADAIVVVLGKSLADGGFEPVGVLYQRRSIELADVPFEVVVAGRLPEGSPHGSGLVEAEEGHHRRARLWEWLHGQREREYLREDVAYSNAPALRLS